MDDITREVLQDAADAEARLIDWTGRQLDLARQDVRKWRDQRDTAAKRLAAIQKDLG